MKALNTLLLTTTLTNAQVPDAVGRTTGEHWATFVGNKYVVAVAHWAPKQGNVITFGNGSTATLIDSWRPRGGLYHTGSFRKWEADVFVGILDNNPVNVEAIPIKWDFQESMVVEGAGFDEERNIVPWFGTATFEISDHTHPPTDDKEWTTGLISRDVTGASLAGASGAPWFTRDSDGKLWLVGCHAGRHGTRHICHPWAWIKRDWPTTLVKERRPQLHQDGTVTWTSIFPYTLATSNDLVSWTKTSSNIVELNKTIFLRLEE